MFTNAQIYAIVDEFKARLLELEDKHPETTLQYWAERKTLEFIYQGKLDALMRNGSYVKEVTEEA